jgi:16S rRNA (uracil1498-N3)-methyltransferase
MHPGDAVCLFNGDGREYPAKVTAIERRSVELEVTGVESPERELGFHLEVAAAMPKGDRADFLVEKLTELGVTAFVLLATERSVVLPRHAKLDRLERHVIEASKQCGRNVLMRVEPLTDWAEYCQREDGPALRLLGHPSAGEDAAGAISDAAWSGDVKVAVGPEGGFTQEEVALARRQGWRLVHLGRRVLRVETAALLLAALASQRGS